MYNVNNVFELAVAQLNNGEMNTKLMLANVAPENLEYRKAVFSNYDAALTIIRRNLPQHLWVKAYDLLKGASVACILNYREANQPTTVAKQEVVVDRIAELEKALKAKTLECNNLKDRLVETETSLNNQINLNQHLATSLRQLSLNKLVTKVAKVVTQKVGF